MGSRSRVRSGSWPGNSKAKDILWEEPGISWNATSGKYVYFFSIVLFFISVSTAILYSCHLQHLLTLSEMHIALIPLAVFIPVPLSSPFLSMSSFLKFPCFLFFHSSFLEQELYWRTKCILSHDAYSSGIFPVLPQPEPLLFFPRSA